MSPLRNPRVLWIATKSPLPPTDGGRLVSASTIDALTDAGAEITLVFPQAEPSARIAPGAWAMRAHAIGVDAPRLTWGQAAIQSLRSGRPLSVERHTCAAVTARVDELVRRTAFDIVHIEQPQALPNAAPAIAAGIASVLRAQNVESLVWAMATRRHRLIAPLFRLEARRFRHFEADALAMVDATVALSSTDATTLATFAPAAHIVCVPPPFSAQRGAAQAESGADTWHDAAFAEREADTPTFTWIGSARWPVNDEALGWLVGEIWPAVAARVPHARLRLFAGGGKTMSARRDAGGRGRADDAIEWHPAPDDCGDAFTSDTILLLPLRTAVGVRMRLLDAWARGVPTIATPAAVLGLDTADGRDLLIASDPRGFADACARLAADRALRARLVSGGRATLARRHDPATVARAMIAVYEEAIERHRVAASRRAR